MPEAQLTADRAGAEVVRPQVDCRTPAASQRLAQGGAATESRPIVLRDWPKAGLLISPTGLANCGVLNMLKNSLRNCRVWFSLTRKFLNKEKSQLKADGPVTMFRRTSPYSPTGATKASGLICNPGSLILDGRIGCPV